MFPNGFPEYIHRSSSIREKTIQTSQTPVNQLSIGKSSTKEHAASHAEKLEKTPYKAILPKIRSWATLPAKIPLNIGGFTVGAPLGIGASLAGSSKGAKEEALTGTIQISPAIVVGAVVTALSISKGSKGGTF